MSQKNFQRNKTYRADFFENNSPKLTLFNKELYQCVYCGKFCSKKKITVDHIIPVNRVKHIGLGRLFMKLYGITDINSVKNLTPACSRCNSKKGTKMGFWLVRSFLGKNLVFWVILWILTLILFAFCLIFAVCYAPSLFNNIHSLTKTQNQI